MGFIPSMQTPRSFINADRACRGKLSTILAAARADGLSTRRIAALLEHKHGVLVSHVTVANWLRYVDATSEPDTETAA